jgi:O-antigen/teichoic acid export membrane protein
MAVLVVLKSNSSFSEVGFYTVAISMAGLLFTIPQIILPVYFPILTKVYGSKKSIVIMYTNIIKLLGATIIPIGLTFGIFSSFFIRMFFGSTYLNTLTYLPILFIAYGFYAIIIWPSRQILDLVGHTKTNLYLTIIRSCVVIALSLILIPSFKSHGLAIAVASGWGIEGFLCVYYIKQKRLLYNHEL